MTVDLTKALRILHPPADQRAPVLTTDPATYLQAAAEVVDNVDRLPYRVFVMLPPRSCLRDTDHWYNVKQHSYGIGHGGLERIIEPPNPREAFEPSSHLIRLRTNQRIFLRPRGAPQLAAYMRLSIEDTDWGPSLIPLLDPFCESLARRHEELGAVGYALRHMADVLAVEAGGRLLLTHTTVQPSNPQVPVASLTAIDRDHGGVTVHLDAAVESFVPVGWRHVAFMN